MSFKSIRKYLKRCSLHGVPRIEPASDNELPQITRDILTRYPDLDWQTQPFVTKILAGRFYLRPHYTDPQENLGAYGQDLAKHHQRIDKVSSAIRDESIYLPSSLISVEAKEEIIQWNRDVFTWIEKQKKSDIWFPLFSVQVLWYLDVGSREGNEPGHDPLWLGPSLLNIFAKDVGTPPDVLTHLCHNDWLGIRSITVANPSCPEQGLVVAALLGGSYKPNFNGWV